MAQTHYQNRGKFCEEIPRQIKNLRSYIKKDINNLKIKLFFS